MKLIDAILDWQPEMAAIRRDIHAHPELAFEEVRTSDLVADLLGQWGIPVVRGLGRTGVVGVIEGQRPGAAAVGLRADMDALPMQEMNTFGHASRNPGKMHACGHDGHTATLLSAARHLAQSRDFTGTVYAIFQPAEEGAGGALAMLNDGLLQRCPMQTVYGLHNWPGLPTGTIGVLDGPVMASSNTFNIRLTGRGAHAAMPHLSVDPVMAAVQLAQTLQTVVTRNRDPQRPAVLSITQIHAGSADNVIPDDAVLCGTVRTFDDDTLDLIERRMADITTHTAAALDCQVDFSFKRGYPPTINDPNEAAFCADIAAGLVGGDRVLRQLDASMGAEDFAFLLRELPGCYVWLGAGDGSHRDNGHGVGPCLLHNPSYDFNDALIPLGASYWVQLARQRLQRLAV